MKAFWNKNVKTGIAETEETKISVSPNISVTIPVRQLSCEELCCKYDPHKFTFSATDEVPVSNNIIGQNYALKVIDLAIRMKCPGYNIFVSGITGTGKNHAILDCLYNVSKKEQVPEDICYVYNYKFPRSPSIIMLAPGMGKQFKIDMNEAIKKLIYMLNSLSQSYDFSEIIENKDVKYSQLIDESFSTVSHNFEKNDDIYRYLNDLKADILKEINMNNPLFEEEYETICKILDSGKYEVNLFIDNSKTEGAPVIIEKNPSYVNLFGFVEYRMKESLVVADHLSLKPGSVHRARGGYLIIEIEEILGDSDAWNALKKMLRFNEACIEDLNVSAKVVQAINLKPDCVSMDLKVVLTGDPDFYQALYLNDDEFKKTFKVKADLVEKIPKSENVINDFVSFIARVCKDELVRHCDREAVARLIDYSSKIVEHKKFLSAQFSRIIDLIREADVYASEKKCKYIGEEHIKKAEDEMKLRCSTLQNKMLHLIEDGSLYVNTEGFETGQINGICLVNTGDYEFGIPSRITARTFTGSGNIINIEREAEMSGKIHAKGIMILGGYLGQTYAQDKPLAFNASICFEQHYDEIDGDSASSAELYCLLSSLSSVPLRQDIAVTGSVDQKGVIQPVGGINAKIEGFFNACLIRGLSGTQGIIIPKANVKNLMLDDQIIDAVNKKKFSIFPVETIEQGLYILTGKEPGCILENSSFQPDTIHFLVNQKLREFASVVAVYEKDNQYI